MKEIIKQIRDIASKSDNDYSDGLNDAAKIMENHIKANTVTIIDDMAREVSVIKIH
tara:strand:- start:399 stop:566 length:168 start_codon:yes stop_codon:yes gene_type:complete